MLKRALKDLSEFLHELPAFRLSLNVTAADLGDPLFLRDLSERMHAAGIAPRHLAIEITEGSTARGTAAAETLLMLRDAGYSVHIDDFGTGYSSLSYLQDLAIDAIKIDRCFTQAVGTGAASMAVLPRVLAMADALHLLVIVEGIETETQARYFLSTGQPLFAQGWLFGHPMTAKDMRQRLRQEREAEACETEKSGTEG